MSRSRIGRVVILGGGTAGWMTAAALAKGLAGTNTAITVVESDAIGTIGVGEATIPTIHWFNALVGLDETAFLRETRATFKLGIEFVGWRGPGSAYFHPFGTYGGPGDATMFPHRLIRGWHDGFEASPDDFSLTAQMARTGRFARPERDPRSPLSTLGYAFHFDAGLYGRFLRGLAERGGVTRIEGKVAQVDRDPATGRVEALALEDGRRVAGDLFVDCSGLRGLLIAETLGAGFEDWSRWLPCDAAWAAPGAPEAGVTPFTRATAQAAGWCWRIPLQHRVGNGHVFATAFQSPDDARDALLAAMEGAPTAEPRLIRFTPGMRRESWVGNVVAIGLAGGFLEPLESTSIHLIQSGIAKLLSLWPSGDCDPLLAGQYNRLMRQEMEGVRDFLILHYAQTHGREEPLWRHCRHEPVPDTLAWKIDQFRASGRIMLGSDELFREASWFAVLTGQGVRARDYTPLIDATSVADNLRHLEAVRASLRDTLRRIAPLPRPVAGG